MPRFDIQHVDDPTTNEGEEFQIVLRQLSVLKHWRVCLKEEGTRTRPRSRVRAIVSPSLCTVYIYIFIYVSLYLNLNWVNLTGYKLLFVISNVYICILNICTLYIYTTILNELTSITIYIKLFPFLIHLVTWHGMSKFRVNFLVQLTPRCRRTPAHNKVTDIYCICVCNIFW